mgnify:FL=1
MKNHVISRYTCYFLLLLFTTAGIQGQAVAAMVGTDQIAAEVTGEQQRQELRNFLQRNDVRAQLTTLGVDPGDAQDRIASLTDSEVRSLYQQVGDLPAGGSALGTVALVLLILILLDVAGATDIFPGV